MAVQLYRRRSQTSKIPFEQNNTPSKNQKCLSEPFEVTLGAFQGDSLSAKLFTLYLAGALQHLDLKSGHKMIIFPQNGAHGGLGFIIKNSLVKYVKDPKIYHDRVASIDLSLSNKTMSD